MRLFSGHLVAVVIEARHAAAEVAGKEGGTLVAASEGGWGEKQAREGGREGGEGGEGGREGGRGRKGGGGESECESSLGRVPGCHVRCDASRDLRPR